MSPLPPEDVLVERLATLFRTRRRDVKVGIGDDAAVVAAPPELAVATDVLVEGQDFTSAADPWFVGRKALSVNVSDLAAMGALPLHALLALGLPPGADLAFVDAVAGGVHSVATEQGISIVGGDLSASATTFLAVTVLGRVSPSGPLRRSGGRPGDALFVSGTLGAAAAGLGLIGAGFGLGHDRELTVPPHRRLLPDEAAEVARLLRHQLNPRPAVDLGRALADGPVASAAIDVSDGLARDLHRLCRASGTGAVVEGDCLPVDTALEALRRLTGADPLTLALTGGEDYGLLFAVPSARMDSMKRICSRFPVRRIGTLDGSGEVRLVRGGQREPLPDSGFDHFAPPPATPSPHKGSRSRRAPASRAATTASRTRRRPKGSG